MRFVNFRRPRAFNLTGCKYVRASMGPSAWGALVIAAV